MEMIVRPIAWVKNSRVEPIDDHWQDIFSEIELDESVPSESFDNIELFSHLEIVFYFDKVNDNDIIFSGNPRGNPEYPLMGIFCQRKKERPNKIGLCTVELLRHSGRTITVRSLDAINGTPILDIKPVFKEFIPKSTIKQPEWVSALMTHYW